MQLNKLLPLILACSVAGQGPVNQTTLAGALGSQNATLSTLNQVLASNPSVLNVLSSLSNVTLLAPSNDAFSALMNNSAMASQLSNPSYLTALLSYHVLNGTYYASEITNQSVFIPTMLMNTNYTTVAGGQRVEALYTGSNVSFYSAEKLSSTVTMANVNFTGGTIHIIDHVLSIPMNITSTLSNANLTAAEGAIQGVNLTQALTSTPELTIFAPNNDAFNAIGNLVGNLTVQQLQGILGYHVVNGTVAYSSMLSNMTVPTVNGQNLTITVENGMVFVNSARVTVPDVLVSNGVVHVINQVLNPMNTTVSINPTATGATPAFSGASTATSGGVPFTSGVATPSTTLPAATSGGGAAVSSTSNPAMPIKTGAIGAAALFGGAVVFANL